MCEGSIVLNRGGFLRMPRNEGYVGVCAPELGICEAVSNLTRRASVSIAGQANVAQATQLIVNAMTINCGLSGQPSLYLAGTPFLALHPALAINRQAEHAYTPLKL